MKNDVYEKVCIPIGPFSDFLTEILPIRLQNFTMGDSDWALCSEIHCDVCFPEARGTLYVSKLGTFTSIEA